MGTLSHVFRWKSGFLGGFSLYFACAFYNCFPGFSILPNTYSYYFKSFFSYNSSSLSPFSIHSPYSNSKSNCFSCCFMLISTYPIFTRNLNTPNFFSSSICSLKFSNSLWFFFASPALFPKTVRNLYLYSFFFITTNSNSDIDFFVSSKLFIWYSLSLSNLFSLVIFFYSSMLIRIVSASTFFDFKTSWSRF